MKRARFSLTAKLYEQSLYAVLAAVATTFLLLLIGLDKLGEGVIGLLYMVPVVWSAARWGQGPGIAAALASGLFFDFFFTPPYYTFAVSRLEDWLILAIFLAVAIVVVDRIQTNLSRAQKSEHEAVFMYELSTMLAACAYPGCSRTWSRSFSEGKVPDFRRNRFHPSKGRASSNCRC